MAAAIEITNLSVRFEHGRQSVHAVRDLSLVVPEGSVFGFLGLNGAGKTTTMHVLLGFIEPTEGRAVVFGTDVQQSIARQRIGYLPEMAESYPFLTGREALWMAGRLFGLNGETLRRRVDDLLQTLNLKDAGHRRIGSYSRGMLQRIGLAQALINDPDLVILDEPTGGLDPLGRLEVRRVIQSLRERGKTVFFSSHELSEVELVCDRIGIISRGQLVAEGRPDELVKPGERLEQYFVRVTTAGG